MESAKCYFSLPLPGASTVLVGYFSARTALVMVYVASTQHFFSRHNVFSTSIMILAGLCVMCGMKSN